MAKSKERLWLAGILIITLLIYLPILRASFLNYDDDLYITENPLITQLSWEHIKSLFTDFYGNQYSPVAMLIMAIEVKIFGLNAAALKFISILLHLLNVAAVFIFMKRLLGRSEMALIIAGIFAVHTLQVESVAWMAASMKVGTYSLFSVLSLIYYLKFLDGGRHRVNYLFSVGWFLLSCLSKEQAVVLPGLLLAIDYYRGRSLTDGKLWGEKIPFFIIALIIGALTMTVADDMRGTPEALPYSVSERILFASYALSAYILKSVVPAELSTFYAYPLIGQIPGWYYLTLLVPVFMIWYIFRAWKKSHKLILFGAAFFLVNLALTFVSQILSVRDVIMADRYMYLSLIGVFIVILPLLRDWLRSKGAESWFSRTVLAYGAMLAVMTMVRTGVWKNDVTFMGNAIEQAEKWNKERSPAMAVTYTNLGVARRKEGNTAEAMRLYQQALVCNPRHVLAFSNMGNIQMLNGQLAQAEENYNKALAIDPEHKNSLSGRGAVYAQQGKYDLAIRDLNKAIEIDPNFIDAYSNRSLTYHSLGNYNKALEDLDRLIALEPDNASYHHDRGIILSILNRKEEGIRSIDQAIRLSPSQGEYYLNRSRIYKELGDMPKAIENAIQARNLGVRVDDTYMNSLQ